MAQHAREQIRDAVATLVTGLRTTGSRVYVSHPYDVAESQLPCLMIYVTGDEVDLEHSHRQSRHVRDMALTIEGRAQGATNLDETLDDIGAEVEAVVGINPRLGGKVWWIEYMGSEIEIDGEHDPRAGMIRMTFAVRYEVNVNAPTTLILKS